MAAATDVPVVFLCPGKPGKPAHDCTPEAVAALEYALRAPPDTYAIANATEALPESMKEEDKPPPTYMLSTVLGLLPADPGSLRAQVQCADPACATVSIVTDTMIRAAQPLGGTATIRLLLPTPGDLALIDAAKGVTGLAAVKAATANATLVLANIALVGTAATTLGLAKSEEIGAKLAKGLALVLLLVALFFTVRAIYCALKAQVVSTGPIRSGNLEEVRALVTREITSRAADAATSIRSLAYAVVAVGLAFAWVTLREYVDDDRPVGALTVVPGAGTLTFAVETKWTGAPDDGRLVLSVVGTHGGLSLTHDADVEDGSVELKRSTTVGPEPGLVRITSALEDSDNETVEGATKEACLRVESSALRQADC